MLRDSRVNQTDPAVMPYPRRIEYQGGGETAFMRPAIAEEADARELERKIWQAFDRVARRHGFR